MTIHSRVSVLGCALALYSMGCSLGSTEDRTYRPGDKDTTSGMTEGKMRVSSETSSATDPDLSDDVAAVATECGDAMGVHIDITDADGFAQSCDQMWADVQVSGDWADGAAGDHYLADCFFVGPPGDWSIDDISAIDSDLNSLSCCTADWDPSVTVDESETTEVNGLIQCTTEQNGALDIYVTVNTPPQIIDVDISPSKFGETCSVITLTATAVDPEGDDISYSWFVISEPAGADYTLDDIGSEAFFATTTLGDYTIRLVVSDETGASHYLDFPLHIVDDEDVICDTNELVGEYCDL